MSNDNDNAGNRGFASMPDDEIEEIAKKGGESSDGQSNS